MVMWQWLKSSCIKIESIEISRQGMSSNGSAGYERTWRRKLRPRQTVEVYDEWITVPDNALWHVDSTSHFTWASPIEKTGGVMNSHWERTPAAGSQTSLKPASPTPASESSNAATRLGVAAPTPNRSTSWSDSQAVLKSLNGYRFASWQMLICRDALRTVAEERDVNLMWVSCHQGIAGNDKANNFARKASGAIPTAFELILPVAIWT